MMVLRFATRQPGERDKGVRVAKAYAEQARSVCREQKLTKPYTLRLPAWIRWSDETAAYELIEDRAELLRWMFEMADDGMGRIQHRRATQ